MNRRGWGVPFPKRPPTDKHRRYRTLRLDHHFAIVRAAINPTRAINKYWKGSTDLLSQRLTWQGSPEPTDVRDRHQRWPRPGPCASFHCFCRSPAETHTTYLVVRRGLADPNGGTFYKKTARVLLRGKCHEGERLRIYSRIKGLQKISSNAMCDWAENWIRKHPTQVQRTLLRQLEKSEHWFMEDCVRIDFPEFWTLFELLFR